MINSLNDAVIDTVLNATPSTTRTAGGKEIPYPFPSPADWRDHWIYLLLVDRFDNPSAPPRSADPCDTYQGGSFAGIKRRLPYLSELAAHFDYRLRVLTTEMRRILAEERTLRLRLGRTQFWVKVGCDDSCGGFNRMAFVWTKPQIREKAMRNYIRKISLYFSAGALGGLTNGAALWLAGMTGLTTYLQVKIAPAWTLPWLYPRVVWGGIWGLVFLLPITKSRVFTRGVLLSLGPTLVQLLWLFPFKAHAGYLGFDLGILTPLFVLVFNAIWGITAAVWIRWAGN